jgi:hypothetical protein
MKITFIFILILFIDSVNRVYRVQLELAAASEGAGNSGCVLPLRAARCPLAAPTTLNIDRRGLS